MFTPWKERWARQKKRKENHATKVTKIPKTKRQKYEMNETKMFMLKPESNCNGRLLKISLNKIKTHIQLNAFEYWIDYHQIHNCIIDKQSSSNFFLSSFLCKTFLWTEPSISSQIQNEWNYARGCTCPYPFFFCC